jgi:SSS family solute:Na+ symporter
MTYPAATIVFLVLIAAVIILGFTAGRWKAGDMSHIEEWGLGGRRFGTLVSWFLIGGDAYRGGWVFCRALYGGLLSHPVFSVPEVVAGGAQSRVHHRA